MSRQVENYIADLMRDCKVETPYTLEFGNRFRKEDVYEFIYGHILHTEFEEASSLNHLNPDLPGIFFGRVVTDLNRVYNDTSDGEYYFEMDMTSDAIANIRVLVALEAEWAIEYTKELIRTKEEKGHFKQVAELLPELKRAVEGPYLSSKAYNNVTEG